MSGGVEDLICGSVAQCRLLSREAGVRYHDRTTMRGYKSNWERSATFVTKRANCLTFLFFYGFYVFLRNINMRSRLTILSNLNSVGR